MSSMTGFFITGTDTDVGKTYVTAALVRQYRAQGQTVAVRKPIASGCGDTFADCDDAHILADASDEDEWVVCPHRFAPSVSPARAMQEANNMLSIDALVTACRAQTQDKLTLVEGAGGWLSPLTPTAYNADLAVMLQLPVILVVANRLGCINHALLTLHHINHSGLICHTLFLNQTTPDNSYDAHDELKNHLSTSYPQTKLVSIPFKVKTDANTAHIML